MAQRYIKRIFLIRHGKSQGNVDISLYKRIPDANIPLTEIGEEQAFNSGVKLAEFIENEIMISYPAFQDENLRIWSSSYLRARQTTGNLIKGMGETLTKLHYDNRVSDLIVEQNFGLFDGLTQQEQDNLYPKESAYIKKMYEGNAGHFAIFPMGESRAQVCNRADQFKDKIWRDVTRENNPVENLIIVSHGVTIRAFIKAFLNHPYEWFENERNPDNCSIQYIERDEKTGIYKNSRYIHSLGKTVQNPIETFRPR